jgi:hypothetical protein
MTSLPRFSAALTLLLCLPMAGALAQSVGNVVGERVTYDGGVVRV